MNPVDPWSTFAPGPWPGDQRPSQGIWPQPTAGPLWPNASPAGAHSAPNYAWSSSGTSGGAATNCLGHGGMPIVQPGCRTGFVRLQEATGGLQGMTILAGPPMSGRSALALGLTRGALAQDPRLAVLYISPSLDSGEQKIRLMAMESGMSAHLIRRRKLDATGCRTCADAEIRLTRDVWPRLLLVTAAGPEPADPDTLAGRPFDPNVVLAYRNHLMQSTAATSCLIVIDDFPSIGVPRGPAELAADGYAGDYKYDPVRLNRLDWLRRMTASRERPEGDPLVVVAGIRKQTYPSWPYQVRGTGQIVETAACVAFLEPMASPQEQTTDVQRLILHVTKARYGRPAEIPLDFDVDRFRFSEV